MKREFVLLRGIWHMMDGNAEHTRCRVGLLREVRKVVYVAKPPKPLCHGCAHSASKLLADMARYNRQPNRRDIPLTRPDSENSPTSLFAVPVFEKTTITETKQSKGSDHYSTS